VCIGFGFVPSSELARALGCAHRVGERSGAIEVERDRHGRTSVEGVRVVGDGGGIQGAQVAQAMGTLAGLDVASSLGRPLDRVLPGERRCGARALARHEQFQRSLWRLYAAPPARSARDPRDDRVPVRGGRPRAADRRRGALARGRRLDQAGDARENGQVPGALLLADPRRAGVTGIRRAAGPPFRLRTTGTLVPRAGPGDRSRRRGEAPGASG